MDILGLVAAFGGGVIGACMGALPVFIMTGLLALVGAIVTAAGATGDIAIGLLAFGSYAGPHIAFAGGVAAAAYAGKTGKISSGTDILSSLNGTGSPDVLLVGGAFGMAGFVIAYLIGLTPLGPMTDLPGITVFILAVITRYMFGTTGLTGKYTGTAPRTYITTGTGMLHNIVVGGGIAIAISFVAAQLYAAGNETALAIYPIICFGFAAFSLIFTQTGFATPASHHIALPAAYAAVAGVTAFGSAGALLGVVFGILGSLLGDFCANTFNSHNDTHIDPPATTIFILVIVISLMKMVIL